MLLVMVKLRRCFKLVILFSFWYVFVVILFHQNGQQLYFSMQFLDNKDIDDGNLIRVTSNKHKSTSRQSKRQRNITNSRGLILSSQAKVITATQGILQTPIITESTVAKNYKGVCFISISENGRLGNQMFEIATLTASALHRGFKPVICGYKQVKQIFDLKQKGDTCIANASVFTEEKPGTYDSRIEFLSREKNWTLNGYFQSWKYFHHYRNEILTLFTFKPNVTNKAIKIIRPFVVQGRQVVGVHIRRGDKAQPSLLKIGNSVATPEYMTKAFKFFRKQLRRPFFVVTSDDRLWTSRYAKGTDIFFVGTGCPGTDLAILSLCNHTIITVGAFGWWGAYLNSGITVYYKNFPSRSSWLSTQYKSSDYYLPDWIGMD